MNVGFFKSHDTKQRKGQTKHLHINPYLCLRDNPVHLHECCPFRVGIFIIFKKKTTIFTV